MTQHRRSLDVDLTYHEWHRYPTLPRDALATDLDLIEVRRRCTPVALTEAKCAGWVESACTAMQDEVLRKLGEASGVAPLRVTYWPTEPPAVVGRVLVSRSIEAFALRDLRTGRLIRFSPEEYADFLRRLPHSADEL